MTDSSHEQLAGLPIVVGIDGSPSSKDALRWAARQAKLTGSSLHVISTWEHPHTVNVSAPRPRMEDLETPARARLDDTVAEVLGGVADVEVTTSLIFGHPAPTLVDHSKSASLLVVGSRGHGEFVGMLLGSVSQFVAAHAACPVVVVH